MAAQSLSAKTLQRVACRAHVWAEDSVFGFEKNDRVWALQKDKGSGEFEWFAGRVRNCWTIVVFEFHTRILASFPPHPAPAQLHYHAKSESR